MFELIVLLFTAASLVLPVAAIVAVWTSSAIAFKIAMTALIVLFTTDAALNNYVGNQGEDEQ